MKNPKQKAFTLAEVLVSLTVIGVISALTLPAINVSAHKRANGEACKKAYAVLSEVMEIARVNEPFEKWTYTDEASVENYNRIKPYLNIVKECIGTSGCWATTKALNNGTATNFTANGYGSPVISFKTADGMNISFDVHSESFNVTRKNANSILFAVDVNGNNAPNRVGDDVFFFVLGDEGLVPAGNDAAGNGDCTRNSTGRDCAARVLKDGGINY